jgi:biotin carboxylase
MTGAKKRILLFAATTGYQVHSFAEAAERLGCELVLATDRCHVLDDPWGDQAIAARTEDPAGRGPFDGVLAVGDDPAVEAAQAAERLGLRFSPPDAVLAAKNKFLSRERFAAAGLLVPGYRLNAPPLRYPCVLKPAGLSASRGVIRADNPEQFAAAYARIRKLAGHADDPSIQVEDFIPGREFALEGLVTRGRLQMIALFDKPDPLDGPFFEETIYVTPSRAPAETQRAMVETTQRAIAALGLTDGPIHAEMRMNDRGVWMLEVAARPIGGLCSRVVRFASGETLEEILLRHAAGGDVSEARLAPGGHAVMMIPIPRAGVYRSVEGLERARSVAGIEDVVIAAKEGQMMLPLPEGASYLGFIFARAESPEEAEKAVRESHAGLRFEFATALPVVK